MEHNEIEMSHKEYLEALEQARIEERKKIGKWLDSHVMGAILKADMEGYEFKAVLEQLKCGELPGGV